MLSVLFLEHLISVLNQTRVTKSDPGKGENSVLLSETQLADEILQAATFALTAFFRYVDQLYSLEFILLLWSTEFFDVPS